MPAAALWLLAKSTEFLLIRLSGGSCFRAKGSTRGTQGLPYGFIPWLKGKEGDRVGGAVLNLDKALRMLRV